jgi:hypothetical protein
MNYDKYGQRLTDCCSAYATYGDNVTLSNMHKVRLMCSTCGKPTKAGEGDQTQFRDGVSRSQWIAAISGS